MSANFSAAIIKILRLAYAGEIDAAERIRAEGIAAGQFGIYTWSKYINALLSTREKAFKRQQKRQKNSKMI